MYNVPYQPKSRGGILKSALFAGMILGSAYIGDTLDIRSRLVNPVRYHNTPVSSAMYQNIDALVLYKPINSQGERQVYLMDRSTGDKMPVDPNMHVVGSLSYILKNEAGRVWVDGVEHAEKIIEKIDGLTDESNQFTEKMQKELGYLFHKFYRWYKDESEE